MPKEGSTGLVFAGKTALDGETDQCVYRYQLFLSVDDADKLKGSGYFGLAVPSEYKPLFIAAEIPSPEIVNGLLLDIRHFCTGKDSAGDVFVAMRSIPVNEPVLTIPNTGSGRYAIQFWLLGNSNQVDDAPCHAVCSSDGVAFNALGQNPLGVIPFPATKI